jgi:hypothetical protein
MLTCPKAVEQYTTKSSAILFVRLVCINVCRVLATVILLYSFQFLFLSFSSSALPGKKSAQFKQSAFRIKERQITFTSQTAS